MEQFRVRTEQESYLENWSYPDSVESFSSDTHRCIKRHSADVILQSFWILTTGMSTAATLTYSSVMTRYESDESLSLRQGQLGSNGLTWKFTYALHKSFRPPAAWYLSGMRRRTLLVEANTNDCIHRFWHGNHCVLKCKIIRCQWKRKSPHKSNKFRNWEKRIG